jgi:pyrroline-5-carboxylate reductase
MQTIDHPILFIGGGNMAHAIISGSTNAGVLNTRGVGVVDPSKDRHALFDNPFTDIADAFAWVRSHSGTTVIIVLAVKPQVLAQITEPLREHIADLHEKPLVISILAGTQIQQIDNALNHTARIIRVMPNTPAQIALAMSAIAAGEHATDADIKIADSLFSSVGKAITIPEDLMDAFTALAGSGPAYLFYLAEAMIEAAIQLGFDKQQAQTITRQTIFGSASLLNESPEMPRQLREKVTSKKGTTDAATSTLDKSGVMDAFVRAIHAARHRGIELGQGNQID